MKSKLNYIEFDFRKEIIDIEKDAIIESMLEELEILELRHKYLTMLRTKKLKNLGIKGIGEEIFARYGFSFMEVEICNEKINIPMLTEIQTMVLNSPFKLKAKKGGKENLHRKSNGINSKKCYLSHNNPT